MANREPVSKGNVLNVAWYDESGTEFTINTIKEMREFAALSEYYDFEGQTIKLGADITDNEGNAADWEEVVPEHLWKPIKNFAGTFDGQGHTISGICSYGFVYIVRYGKTEFCKAGMFTDTKASCTIKDFRLVNSFIYSDFNEGAGSISSNGGGTFDSIYSNAVVLSYKENTGGIIGCLDASGAHTITNCWFDGVLRVEGNVGHYAGGVVGQVGKTGGTCKIEHCLNTGSLSSTLKNTGVNLGGIIGVVMDSGRVQMSDCLSVGDITNEYGIAVGSVIGQVAGAASINDVYALRECYKALVGYKAGATVGFPIEYTRRMLTGYGGYQWTTLDFDYYWSVVEDGTPVLKYFTGSSPSLEGIAKKYDTSWYEKGQTECVIMNAEQLYGFTILSRKTDFSGVTVKLGADIVINEGDAADWAEKEPEYSWNPISTGDYPFNGVFDGQMHSISGIWCKTNSNYSGLFSATTELSVIKNLKVLNSYYEFGGQSSGSIAGRGRGNFDTIYSNAIIRGSNINLGGIVGQIPGDSGILMNNCWFDGQVTNTSNSLSTRYTGGLVGVVLTDSVMKNCLNTGTVDATKFTTPNPNNAKNIVPLAGGLIGYIPTKKTMTIEGCLNVGKVKVNEVASIGYGSIAGYVDGSVKVSKTYAVADSSDLHSMIHGTAGELIVVDASILNGYGAYQRTLLDFDEYWAVVKNSTPVLKSFVSDAPDLSGVKKLYDVSWYSPDKSVYVLDSLQDLHGFALLSYDTNFKGKTIKLAANIVVNTGYASAWAQNAPQNKWIEIGNSNLPFAGTFDGQMHSISGIYVKTEDRFGGVFAKTTPTAVIKNVRLLNTYIEAEGGDCGSIVGRGEGGVFDTIYSNAIVRCTDSRVGGMFGQLYGDKITINNCWFDGAVTGTGNSTSARTTGGILGLYAAKTGSMTNCLNTGIVDATAYTYNQKTDGTSLIVPLAGGLIGQIWENVHVDVGRSLNAGEVKVSQKAADGNIGFGAIYGWTDGTVKVVDTYATAESCKRVSSGSSSKQTGRIRQVSADSIKGYDAYRWTYLDFAKYWAVKPESTPVLRSFAGSIPSLAGIEKMIDNSWYDASKTEYVLKDSADLFGFADLSKEIDFKGKTVKLGANIVVNKDMKHPGYNWTQIGSTNKPFAGTFDGQMHSISGIYLKTDERFGGLFAETTTTAVIKNVSLLNSYINAAGADTGSIVGRGKGGTFDTIYSNATVLCAGARVGGLFGQLHGDSVTINNCWFDGTVTATGNSTSARDTGGIIGLYAAKTGSMKNCLHTGVVDATAYTYNQKTDGTSLIVPVSGGIIGHIWENVHVVLEQSLNVGEVKVSQKAADGNVGFGAIYGWADGTIKVSGVYATAESCKRVSSGSSGNQTGTIKQVAVDTIKGYDGYQWTVLDFDRYWAVVVDDEGTAETDESGTPILKSFAAIAPSLANKDKMIDFSWMYEAAGTESDPYILKDIGDLYGFAEQSQTDNFAGKTIKLGADIDLNPGFIATTDGFTDGKDGTPIQWKSIGSTSNYFKGIFDGDGHTISGLYQNTGANTGNLYLGLFAATSGVSTVKNFHLENSFIYSNGMRFGSIAGDGCGNFQDIYSNAIIVTGSRDAGIVGGMIGYFDGEKNVTYSNLHFGGTLTGDGYWIGGILGQAANSANTTLTIENCRNSGAVSTSYAVAGGMVGIVNTTKSSVTVNIAGCWNSGTVSAPSNCGVFVGRTQNGTPTVNISDCLNSYNIPNYPVGSLNTGTVTCQRVLSVRDSVANMWNESSGGAGPNVPGISLASITGFTAEKTLTAAPYGFDFETDWAVQVGYPVPMAFADVIPNVDWYDESASSYVLNDAGDLYGFAELSRTNNFAGKTIKLGADIDLNPGFTASTEGFTDGKGGTPIQWKSISSTSLYFKGVFDGDGHTISGLYQNTGATTGNLYLGLFAATSGVSTVKNFRLENSYIYSQGARIGGIAGNGDGNFENIYSNAIIVTAGTKATAIGGMVGYFDGGTSVAYSGLHFDGTVTGSGYYVGGILGQAANSANTTLTIENCKSSGTVSSSDVGTGSMVGLVETTASSTVVNITGCWNEGSASATGGVQGIFVGRSRGSGAPTVNISNCLNSFVNTLNPVGSQVTGTVNVRCVLSARESDVKIWPSSGAATSVAPSALEAAAAQATLTPYGFDFTAAWVVRADDVPVPAYFDESAE
ncbi:MAG: hypothetical protein J5482_03765 [Oscillospiraceae bacterium]|nr:hypothetical protein [Oscillospiraceae bacterium]